MKNLFKKLLIICGVVGAISLTMASINSQQVFADNGFTGNCRDFLGLKSWDCGVNISDENSLKSGIWTIAANVAVDITVVAAYLVLGYVIYGGYLYTFSGGDPGKVATGKKTLYQAFLGLAIVMAAYAIMSTIRFALLGSNGALDNCISIKNNAISGSCADPVTVISGSISWFIAIAGIVSAIFVVYGGISYTTSTGDPGKIQKAKSMIIYALIGLAIVALAEIITAFVTNMIRNSIPEETSIKNTTISKEISYYEKNF